MFENDIDSCEIYLMILTLIAAAAGCCGLQINSCNFRDWSNIERSQNYFLEVILDRMVLNV